MKDIFKDTILFDPLTGHFVRKNELSEEAKKAYQEHAEAHIKIALPKAFNKNSKSKIG